MVKIDLITGFLGAGKTTFLREYAKYLMEQGQSIGILENDFGAVNVDMMLLQDLAGDNCELEMVSGGCDEDCHRRRFRTKLIAMGMCGYDRVIVEPSGIFDVDEFFDVLRDEPLDRWYEIGNVITVVDANLEEQMSEEAEYLLASESACSGQIILSHADEVSEKQIEKVIRHLNLALEKIKCSRRVGREIIPKGIPQLTMEDFDRMINASYRIESYQKMSLGDRKGFESVYIMNRKMSESELIETVKKIMNNPACGDIFRIKGFTKQEDDSWVQLNATRSEMIVSQVASGQEVVIVIGEKLDEERINQAFSQTDKNAEKEN